MSPERWQQIKIILEATLAAPSPRRAVYLNEICGTDVGLRREVESLLAFENPGVKKDIFESAHFSRLTSVEMDGRGGFIGRQIGKYRIVRELGAGGMGVVFLAERTDGEFSQQVAVKFLRQSFYSQAMLNRFLSERKILGRLNHQFIARMIDADTTADGTPYFIMEYVEGTPLTTYVDERKPGLEERLELFRKICEAVSFAHRNLIVHRDLKPDNILITNDGTPKLLDFGIAKLLTENETKATVTRQQAFTPEYASPEQTTGGTITTASDVYVLGIILYELLSGNRPFRLSATNNRQKIWHTIDQTEPPKPSRAIVLEKERVRKEEAQDLPLAPSRYLPFSASQIKGDLDNIILKALKYEPEKRYASVERLAEDLRRYQVNLPVSARAETFFYRAGKFIGRNQWAMFTVSLVSLSLIIGIIGTWQQSRRAERERLRAESRAENLRKISKSLVFDIHDAIRNLPGSLPARELLLERAVEQLNLLSQDSESDPALQEELARAYFNVGEMQQALGDVAAAAEFHQRAVTIYEKLAFENPQVPGYRRGLASGYDFLANIAYLRGEIVNSSQLYARTPPIFERLAAEHPNDEKTLEVLWNAYQNYAVSLNRLGKWNEALAINRRALDIAEQLNRTADPGVDRRQMLYLSEGSIGATYNFMGNYQEAIGRLEKVVAEAEKLHREYPEDTRFHYDLWAFNRRLGTAYDRSGRFSAARQTLEKSLGLIETLMKSSPKDAGYRRNASITRLALAQVFLNRQMPEEAFPILSRARDLSESLLVKDPNNGETIADLALIYGNLGTASAQSDKFAESFSHQEKSLEFFNRSLVKNSENVLIKRDYAETLERTAAIFAPATKRLNRKKAKDWQARLVALLDKSRESWQ